MTKEIVKKPKNTRPKPKRILPAVREEYRDNEGNLICCRGDGRVFYFAGGLYLGSVEE